MTEEAKKWLREGMKKGFCSYEWCETHNPIVFVDNKDKCKCFVVVQIFENEEN